MLVELVVVVSSPVVVVVVVLGATVVEVVGGAVVVVGRTVELVGTDAGLRPAVAAGRVFVTDWMITDGVSHATEVIKLANAYALKAGDFLFA